MIIRLFCNTPYIQFICSVLSIQLDVQGLILTEVVHIQFDGIFNWQEFACSFRFLLFFSDSRPICKLYWTIIFEPSFCFTFLGSLFKKDITAPKPFSWHLRDTK